MTIDDIALIAKNKKIFEVRQIQRNECSDFILNIHYAKRWPSISYAFGLFDNNEMIGCVTYGSPASPRVCEGICGKEHSKKVLELNRFVLKYNRPNEASFLISKSLKLLPQPSIVLSYADTSQDHVGYVYQATNWIYLGLSEIRTDRIFIDGTKQKHGRHVISTDIDNIKERTVLVQRPRKHRYLQIISNKYMKKELLSVLKYDIITEYPKGKKHKKNDSFELKTFTNPMQMSFL
jgi:hypothetical protein